MGACQLMPATNGCMPQISWVRELRLGALWGRGTLCLPSGFQMYQIPESRCCSGFPVDGNVPVGTTRSFIDRHHDSTTNNVSHQDTARTRSTRRKLDRFGDMVLIVEGEDTAIRDERREVEVDVCTCLEARLRVLKQALLGACVALLRCGRRDTRSLLPTRAPDGAPHVAT